MGSLGTSRTSVYDPFNGALGARSTEDAITRLIDVNEYNLVNPNYAINKLYRTNCALCATAVVLQALGYNVEAMPKDENKWRGFDSVFEVDYTNTDNYFLSGSRYGITGVPRVDIHGKLNTIKPGEMKSTIIDNPPRAARGADAVAKQIEEKAKGWGNGAVGVLNVRWKDRNSAHAINIINRNGRILGYDAQSNKVIMDLPKYMKRTTANHTSLVRLDNAQIKNNITQETLDKMFKKSSRKKN